MNTSVIHPNSHQPIHSNNAPLGKVLGTKTVKCIEPTRKPVHYHGPSRDRTQYLHTEVTPQATSCPARSFHAIKHNPNDETQATLDNLQPLWNAQVLITIHVGVYFERCPGCSDINICWFNFDARAEGNTYNLQSNR